MFKKGQIFKILRVQPLSLPQNMWKKGLKRSITSVWYIVSCLCDSITSVWVGPNCNQSSNSMGLFWFKTSKKFNLLDTYSSYISMFHWAQLILGFNYICTLFGIISLFNLLCNSWEKILDKTSFWSFDPIPEPISNTWWLIVLLWSYSSYFCQLIIVYLLFI